MTPTLVFDIETIPDTAGFSRLHDLPSGIPDHELAETMLLQRRQATGNDFLPHYLHRVVAISCALRMGDQFRVWTLGRDGEAEKDIIQRFYDGIEKYTPQIISWNGSGFDLPVLHYRGLMHNVTAPRYWDQGEDDKEFKWNNYISRYHSRHLDLMDLLAMYQPRGGAPLDQLAKLCGFPGKLGMDGSKVGEAFLAGKLGEICDYCETDVVNTHLLFLRFELMRGTLSTEAYHGETAKVRAALQDSPGAHWQEFLAVWKE